MSPGAEPRSGKRAITVPLLRCEPLGGAYYLLSFEVRGGLVARPGQFVMLRGADWSEAPLLPRPMSLLSAGPEPAVLLKAVGAGTRRMASAQPGDQFLLVGALGRAWPDPQPGRRPVLIAGGVGLAPLLFFARELVRLGRRPLLVYGGRSAVDMPLVEEAARVSELVLVSEDGSLGHRGRVTDVLDPVLGARVEVFACGPQAMLARVASLCHERGLPSHVSLEARMACGYGVCLGCPVPVRGQGYWYVCVDGPCCDAHLIDWASLEGRSLSPGDEECQS